MPIGPFRLPIKPSGMDVADDVGPQFGVDVLDGLWRMVKPENT